MGSETPASSAIMAMVTRGFDVPDRPGFAWGWVVRFTGGMCWLQGRRRKFLGHANGKGRFRVAFRAMSFAAVILSGGGAFGDPWHPLAETSRCLADIVTAAGGHVEVDENVTDRLDDLDDVDLIVVNAAVGPTRPPSPDGNAGLRAYLARGGGVLAVHVGVCGLAGVDWWSEVTGARWIDGLSGHPPLGPSAVSVVRGSHPIVDGAVDFDVVDERYTGLAWVPSAPMALLEHELDGVRHPLMWVRSLGEARIVSDALGHDAESYESAHHVALIARAARWAAGQPVA
ncbi:hypothetical protein acdb102_23530 [Acidothermaceae bacterium B102]|nr:hypothetical protein acdb102_23530 [Acidothermaceae bacterium B102]